MTPDPQTNNLIGDENPGNSERQSSSWDIKNAPRNYFWLVIFQAGSALFSFASVLVLTRYLGSDGYGGIVAIVAASQVAQVLVNWTSVAVVRFGVEEFIETEKIARTFWIRLIVLAVNLAFVLIFANLWFPPLASWLKLSAEAFWLVIVHFAFSALWVHIQMSLQGTKMPRLQGMLQMLERLLILAGLIIFLFAGQLEVYRVMICYISAPLAMTLVGSYKLRTFILSHFTVDRRFIRKIVLYSAPLAPMAFVGYFAGSYLDAIFVANFLSTRDLGIYSVATQMNGIVLQLPTIANTLLIPLFITLSKEGLDERIKAYFRHTLPVLTLGWGFFCILGSVAGYKLIPLIFGEGFMGATAPFWILITSSVVGIPIFFGYAAVTHSSMSTYIAAIASAFSASINILFNFLLIPIFGIEGCAWATVIAYLVNVIVFAVLLHTKISIPLSWVFVAILPNLTGAIIFAYTKHVYLALLMGTIFTLLLTYIHWNSVGQSIHVLRRIVKN